MLPLAELQRTIHSAILGTQGGSLATTGAVTLEEALSIHRGTAIGGLVNALRLSHPTVDALVGERYFDQAAHAFVLAQPPQRASLDGYGADFAAFLESLPTAQGLPYLADVARLDWALDKALHVSGAVRAIALDAQVAMHIPTSLSVQTLSYPAHAIRGALGDDDAMAAIRLDKAAYAIAIWRRADTAAVVPLRPAAAQFLKSLLAGLAPEDAVATAEGEQSDHLSIIQADIFAAPFCTVAPLTEEKS